MLLRLINKTPEQAIATEIQACVADASGRQGWGQFQWDYPSSGFGIAALAPMHINAGGAGWTSTNYWGTSIAASVTWQDWQNTTITDMAYIIVSGIFDREATMKVTDLRPRIGGDDKPVVHVEELATMLEARAFFEKPYSLKPGNPCVVRVKADNTGQERIGEMGYCIAKMPFLIREG